MSLYIYIYIFIYIYANIYYVYTCRCCFGGVWVLECVYGDEYVFPDLGENFCSNGNKANSSCFKYWEYLVIDPYRYFGILVADY